MDDRLRFIDRLLEGEKMAPVCSEFGISRVTGYKIFERYKACGLEDFIRVYNQERPHQALGAAYPAEIYTPSARPYAPPHEYPFHDRTVRVTRAHLPGQSEDQLEYVAGRAAGGHQRS